MSSFKVDVHFKGFKHAMEDNINSEEGIDSESDDDDDNIFSEEKDESREEDEDVPGDYCIR